MKSASPRHDSAWNNGKRLYPAPQTIKSGAEHARMLNLAGHRDTAGLTTPVFAGVQLDWLKSPEAALTLQRAKGFVASKPGKRHLVFAPARYVSLRLLDEQNIPVEFVPLPFALYRIERT